MTGDIKALSDQQAVDAVNLLAESWLDGRGREAYAVMQKARAFTDKNHVDLPLWAIGPAKVTPDVAETCRIILMIVVEGRDAQAGDWARAAVSKITGKKAYAVDPLTLAIGGTNLIGLVLAARVKRIDGKGVDFEPGLPNGLEKLTKAAGGFLTGIG
jgi:hypothetical protein